GGLRAATAEEAEGLIESIDHVHNVVAGPLGISGYLPREIRALYRDGRYEPGCQSTESEKGDGEKKSHRLCATERPARHFCHQRVQQISQNHRDGHRDQDRLEETNDISAGPNHRADNHDEKNHTEGCESRPHHLALPRRRITAYVRRENVGGHWVGFVFVGGPLPIGAFVLSILFARFLFFGSSASAFRQDSSASGRRFKLK